MARRPRRRQSGADAFLKVIPAAFLALVLLLTKGDLRKFPAALNQVLSLLVWTAVLAVIAGVVYLVIRRLRRGMSTRSVEPTQSAPPVAAQPPRLAPKPVAVLSTAPRQPSDTLVAIDWFQFEKTIARLLRLEGLHVEMRGGSNGDGGVDLIATVPDGETQLVQCKFWKAWDLNLRAVRELIGARESSEFKPRKARAVIYTLSEPTSRATSYARENDISLVTRDEIERRLNQHPISSFPELMNPERKTCPKCDAPMVKHVGFWGCSNFGRTRCRGKIQDESRAVPK